MREPELAGPLIVGSVLDSDAESALRRLASAPAGAALLELRADLLPIDAIERIVRGVPRPMIVTIRHRRDGGAFDGSEDERGRALRTALAAGARFVDVEWDGPHAALADDPARRGRVILSSHGVASRRDALADLYREIAARPAAAHKIVAEAASVEELVALPELLRSRDPSAPPLALFALGRAGALSRLLAPSWGAWATYGALGNPTAPGQYTVEEMLDTYDVLAIGKGTRRFGLVGDSVRRSPSPAMHGAAYREAGIDARYFAIETDELEAFARLIGSGDDFALEAFGVTIPFKEAVAGRSRAGDEPSAACGAVNTVLTGSDGWVGYNTDGPAALRLIREKLDPRGRRTAILGAGGTARAVAWALARAGAQVTLYNRTESRAERAARALGVDHAPEEAWREAGWEILVHATPRGSDGARVFDPDRLTGRLVLDAVYAPGGTTRLVSDARARGLATIDGLQLLESQAVIQFERMTGVVADRETMHDAARAWMSAGRA